MTKITPTPSGCNQYTFKGLVYKVSHPIYQDQPEDELKIESNRFMITSEDMVRWMTEGTNPHLSPRSDCG